MRTVGKNSSHNAIRR